MPVHFKDKLIQDDPEYGHVDDYVGPGIFVSLIAIIAIVTLMVWVFGKVLLS